MLSASPRLEQVLGELLLQRRNCRSMPMSGLSSMCFYFSLPSSMLPQPSLWPFAASLNGGIWVFSVITNDHKHVQKHYQTVVTSSALYSVSIWNEAYDSAKRKEKKKKKSCWILSFLRNVSNTLMSSNSKRGLVMVGEENDYDWIGIFPSWDMVRNKIMLLV